jgi:hypothetical protein
MNADAGVTLTALKDGGMVTMICSSKLTSPGVPVFGRGS